LEKVHAQEAELRTLRERAQAKAVGKYEMIREHLPVIEEQLGFGKREAKAIERVYLNLPVKSVAEPDPVQQVQDALKAYRSAREPEARRRALVDLEKALAKLKERSK